MGVAVDTVAGAATNPGATVTGVTMNSGDSLTVRNFNMVNPAYLIALYRQGASAGIVRTKSPLLHDNVQGIRYALSQTPAVRTLPRDVLQQLQPQDTLTLEVTGGGAEVDVAGLSIYYRDLPGAMARLRSPGDIKGAIKNITTVQVTCTTAGTAGAWADTAINATFDLLHANTDYAVLGYEVDAACSIVAIKGIDTSNLRVSGVGSVDGNVTGEWFLRQSDYLGLPYIPIINSANKSSTYVSLTAVATAATVNVTLSLAELTHTI